MASLVIKMADLTGTAIGSGQPATAEVLVGYTWDVSLADGTILSSAPVRKTLGSGGTVSFDVTPSDDSTVHPDWQGFGVRVEWRITYRGNRGRQEEARGSRTVKVLASHGATVQFGTLSPAEPVPPQWVTVAELTATVDETAATEISTPGTAANQAVIDTAGTAQDPSTAALIGNPATDTYAALDAQRAVLRALGGGADETARLNDFLASTTPEGPKTLIGAFSVTGTVIIPAGVKVTGHGASITQKTALTNTVSLAHQSVVDGLTVVGLGTDYTDASAVYDACAFRVAASADVTITNCTVTDMAGAGIYVPSSPGRLRVNGCRFVGVGSPAIAAGSYRGGGIVINNDGATALEVTDTEIAGFTQGILTGTVFDLRVTGCFIHDIPGQHGIYTAAATRIAIVGNVVRDTNYEGCKVQIGSTSSPDAAEMTISANTFARCGSNGIHLAQTVGGTPVSRRLVVSGNLVSGTSARGGDGILLESVVGAAVTGNHCADVRSGIALNKCQRTLVAANVIDGAAARGLSVLSSKEVTLHGNAVYDPASANVSDTEFGIYIDGAATSDVQVIDNRVVDTLGNMRYGLFFLNVTPAIMSTISLVGNALVGATDYGVRLGNGGVPARMSGNTLRGGSGALLGMSTTLPVLVASHAGTSTYAATGLPTSGVYAVGDTIRHRTPTAGETAEWTITVAGGLHSGNWAGSTDYAAGTWVRTAAGRVLEATTGGTSGTTEPTVPAAIGGTVTDGTVVWTYRASAPATAKVSATVAA